MKGLKFMAIAIILGIVLFVLAVAAGIGAGYLFESDNSVGGTLSVVACLVLAIAFLVVPFSIRTVEAGEIAVVKELGKIIDTREAGTHFDFWMTRSYEKYDTKVRLYIIYSFSDVISVLVILIRILCLAILILVEYRDVLRVKIVGAPGLADEVVFVVLGIEELTVDVECLRRTAEHVEEFIYVELVDLNAVVVVGEYDL